MEKECRLLRSSGSGADAPKGNLAPIILPGGVGGGSAAHLVAHPGV